MTLVKSKLPVEQATFFRRSGYLKLPLRLDENIVREAIAQIKSDAKQQIQPFRCDESGKLHRLDAIYQRHNIFKQILEHPEILDCLESLLGPNIELVLNRHNHATLNHRGASSIRLHRDVLQWSRDVVTAAFFLEDSTVENGCTWLIPTSQYLPFVGTPNNGGTWMDKHSIFASLIEQSLPSPMSKGSVLLFDSLAFHTVGTNNTSRTRISITAAYHSVDELDERSESVNKVIVRGTRLYRGNDQY